jgi:hypothetical protein
MIMCYVNITGSVTTILTPRRLYLPTGIEMRNGIIEHMTPNGLQIFLLNIANT